MKLLADLQVIDDQGNSHGQYPDLRKINSPILAKLTREHFADVARRHPELKAAVAEIIKADFSAPAQLKTPAPAAAVPGETIKAVKPVEPIKTK